MYKSVFGTLTAIALTLISVTASVSASNLNSQLLQPPIVHRPVIIHRAASLLRPRAQANPSYIGSVTTMPNFNGFVASATYNPNDGHYYIINSFGLQQVTSAGQMTQIASLPFGARDVVFDPVSGNFFATESSSYQIVSITPTGTVSLLAGGTSGTADGQGSAAQFQWPTGMTLDPVQHVLYVFDVNRVRRIDLAGNVKTLGLVNLLTSYFFQPIPIVFDTALHGIAIVDNGGNEVRLFDPVTAQTSVLAGNCVFSLSGGCVGYQLDGTRTRGLFAAPDGIAYDTLTGELYVSDTTNYEIRRISKAGNVTTIAGNGRSAIQDGVHLTAEFQNPTCETFNPNAKSLLVCDNGNLRFVTVAGSAPPLVQTFVMSPAPTLLAGPTGIAETADGSLWFAENTRGYVGRRFPSGAMREYPLPGGFGQPADVIAAPGGGIIFVDVNPLQNGQPNPNAYIARMTASGAVRETLFPNRGGGFSISTPSNLTLDSIANVWFVDSVPSSFGYLAPSGRIVQYLASINALALGREQTVWGTTPYNSQLFKYSTSGVLLQVYPNLPDESGIATAANGHLWLLSDRFSEVSDFDPITATAIVYSIPSCGCQRLLANPTFGPDGALYFTEGGGNLFSTYPPTVGRMTTTGSYTEYPIYEPRSQPSGIAFDSHGTPWITDLGANKIGYLGLK